MENEKSSICFVGLSVQVELPKGATAQIRITSKEEQLFSVDRANNTPPPLSFSHYNEDFYLRYIN